MSRAKTPIEVDAEDADEEFFMCFVPGRSGPTKEHATEEAAEAEGLRLLSKDGGVERVIILRAVSLIQRDPPPHTKKSFRRP